MKSPYEPPVVTELGPVSSLTQQINKVGLALDQFSQINGQNTGLAGSIRPR